MLLLLAEAWSVIGSVIQLASTLCLSYVESQNIKLWSRFFGGYALAMVVVEHESLATNVIKL